MQHQQWYFLDFTHSDSLMSCRSDFSWFRSRENRNPRGKSFDRLHDPLGMQGRLGVHATSHESPGKKFPLMIRKAREPDDVQARHVSYSFLIYFDNQATTSGF